MNKIKQVFWDFGNSAIELLPNIISGILLFVILTSVGILLKKIIKTRLSDRWKDTMVSNFVGDVVKWVFITLGIIIALQLIGFGGIGSSILAGAGISAIVIGFAFKDIAENFLAGIMLAVKRPFKKGDIIQIENFKGPVQALELRTTHIRTEDGKDIFIPNSMIVKNVLINYTKDGLIRQEFLVGLDTFDNLSKAREIILSYFSQQPDILSKPSPNMLVTEIGESSVSIKILFWVDLFKPKELKNESDTGELIKSKVMREVKDLLLKNGFNLPSVIVEHKMYKDNSPLQLTFIGDETKASG